MIAEIEDVIHPIAFVIVICSIIERIMICSTSEHGTPYAHNTIGDRDVCKTSAIIERSTSNTCDAVRNDDT